MAVSIFVRGEAEYKQAPERATCYMSVSMEGYDKNYVHENVSSTLATLQSDIESMKNETEGPVTWYSVSNASNWSWQSNSGAQHRESIDVSVKFSDFTVLGNWIDSVMLREYLKLSFIRWDLTEKRKQALQVELRTKAVNHARQKAEQYAEAAGLHVTAIKAIADAGMLGNGFGYGSTDDAFAVRAGLVGSSSENLALKPEDITVSASVDAEFLAE